MVGSVVRRDMLSLIAEFVFLQLGCLRLTARTHRRNRLAQKLLSRAGFEYEATQKRYFGPDKGDDALLFVLWPQAALSAGCGGRCQ